VCMMLGMEVKSCVAPPRGVAPPCFGCGKLVDAGGHHLMTCNRSAAFNAAHICLQERVSSFAQIPIVTKVASTRRTGLPHEKPVWEKKSDLAVTVVHPPHAQRTADPRSRRRVGALHIPDCEAQSAALCFTGVPHLQRNAPP